MGLFGFRKKEEYDEIYEDDIFDNGDDDGIDYSEVDGYGEEYWEKEEQEEQELNERIASLKERGITSGDCPICNGNGTMNYDGYICFICSNCGNSMHEDDYYYWLAGGSMEFSE